MTSASTGPMSTTTAARSLPCYPTLRRSHLRCLKRWRRQICPFSCGKENWSKIRAPVLVGNGTRMQLIVILRGQRLSCIRLLSKQLNFRSRHHFRAFRVAIVGCQICRRYGRILRSIRISQSRQPIVMLRIRFLSRLPQLDELVSAPLPAHQSK